MTTYLVDGYNLLFFLSYDSPSLERGREKTISLLIQANQVFKGEICLIFDSNFAEKKNQYFLSSQIKVEFAPNNLSADEYIIEKLQGANKTSNFKVVSSDKSLTMQVKELGVKTISVYSFLQKLRKSSEKNREEDSKPTKESSKELSRLAKIFKSL